MSSELPLARSVVLPGTARGFVLYHYTHILLTFTSGSSTSVVE